MPVVGELGEDEVLELLVVCELDEEEVVFDVEEIDVEEEEDVDVRDVLLAVLDVAVPEGAAPAASP